MGCSTFYLCYETSLRHRHQFQAVDLNDAKMKARETLRAIVLPTDRPGYSIKWAYLEHSGEKVWLIKKGRWEGEAVITVPEGKENQLVMPERLLRALLMSHFYLATLAAGGPVRLLDRKIKDVRIDGDSVIIFYEEEGT